MINKDRQTLLIDGDIVCYQMCLLNEYDCRWDDGIHTLHCNEDEVKASVLSRIKWLKDKAKLSEKDNIIFALSSPTSFRKNLNPEYKDHRKSDFDTLKIVRQPLGLKFIKEWAQTEVPCVTVDTLEADDVLGILSTDLSKKTVATSLGDVVLYNKRAIVSIDKDFESVPGWVFNPKKDEKPRFISEAQANYRFFQQVLTGDQSDGYKGCPGFGPVKATKLLDSLDTTDVKKCWEEVVAIFEKHGCDREYALLQARMARILRAGEFSSKTGVILWGS